MAGDQYNETLVLAQEKVADRDYAMRVRLVAKGFPYEKAFAMSPVEALAITVILGETEGYRFDWDTLEWAAAKSPFVEVTPDATKLARKLRTVA